MKKLFFSKESYSATLYFYIWRYKNRALSGHSMEIHIKNYKKNRHTSPQPDNPLLVNQKEW